MSHRVESNNSDTILKTALVERRTDRTEAQPEPGLDPPNRRAKRTNKNRDSPTKSRTARMLHATVIPGAA